MAGCGAFGGERAWFEDWTEASGINYLHDCGQREGSFFIPEMTSGGGALFDMDNDGDLDLYFAQGGHLADAPSDRPANQLFRNDGNFQFTNVSEGSGAEHRGFGQGAAAGDYDGDGDEDLFLSNLGPDVLLRNDGDGHFTDVSEAAGLDDEGWGTSATFLDYDQDRDLDLMVVRFLDWSLEDEVDCTSVFGAPDYCSPLTYEHPATSLLYRNEGNGRFEEVSEAAGFTIGGTGLGIVAGDFDQDGWIDVFVANDGMADRLWINQGDGTFVDRASLYGVGVDQAGNAKAGMGTAASDFDFDGDEDLIVCNLAQETDSFFVNQEGSSFIDRTIEAGLAGSKSRQFTRFGVGWLDFDNDGLLDLYEANGRVRDEVSFYYREDDIYAEPNLLLRGNPEATFEEVLPRGGTSPLLASTSRGAIFGDIDNDGGIDVIVVNRIGHPHVLRNQATGKRSWLIASLREENGGHALGAQVSLSSGDWRPTFRARTGYSYLASNDPRVHVGLDTAKRIENVMVTWTDGVMESFGDFNVNQQIELRRGQGTQNP